MRALDEQERLIVRELIRDPRHSDHGIGKALDLNTRTVARKRQKMEEEGILSYHTHVDFSEKGTGECPARHLYIIKFSLGITLSQVAEDIKREPFVCSIFTESIYESHIAEIDGRIAMLLFIEGKSDADIVETVQKLLVPKLRGNHGKDAIEEISTFRLLAPVRIMHNYLPFVNMENGYMKKEWPDEAIYVGK